MAAKAKAYKPSTITFTLPLSCQICLGKVKQPVLCPNHHVFCQLCMDIWLQRNQQCPTCRVDIGPNNPVKQIIGGQLEAEEPQKKSTPILRRARFDLLYKEYEDEFEKLRKEVIILRTENNILAAQLKDAQVEVAGNKKGGNSNEISSQDGSSLLQLTKNLQEAQKLYCGIKEEMSSLKQENGTLKDENITLTRENETLRLEIAQRSPKKYGRFTVATLETKVSEYEKELRQLKGALERSDMYIEDLEKQIEKLSEISNGNEDQSKEKSFKKALHAKQTQNLNQQSDVGLVKKECMKGINEKEKEGDHRQLGQADIYSRERMQSIQNKSDAVKKSCIPFGQSAKRALFEENNYTSGKTLKSKENSTGLSSYKPDSILKAEFKQNCHENFDTDSNMNTKERAPKKVQFDVPNQSSDKYSFELEMPSPIVGEPTVGQSNNPAPRTKHTSVSASTFSQALCVNSTSDEFRKREKTSNDDSDKEISEFDKRVLCLLKKAKEQKALNLPRGFEFSCDAENDKDTPRFGGSSQDTRDSSHLSVPDLTSPDKKFTVHNTDSIEGLDDTKNIHAELHELDISMTPEMTECLKLMSQAEKKCGPLSEASSTNGRNQLKTVDMVKSQNMPISANPVVSAPFSASTMPRPYSGFSTSGTMSSWEQQFFSGLKANPYKHASNLVVPMGMKIKDSHLEQRFNEKDSHRSTDFAHGGCDNFSPNCHRLPTETNIAYASSVTNHSQSSSMDVGTEIPLGSVTSCNIHPSIYLSGISHATVAHEKPSIPVSLSSSSFPTAAKFSALSSSSSSILQSFRPQNNSQPLGSQLSEPPDGCTFSNPLPPSLNNSALEWPEDSLKLPSQSATHSDSLSLPEDTDSFLRQSNNVGDTDSLLKPLRKHNTFDYEKECKSKSTKGSNFSYASSAIISSDLNNSSYLSEPKKRLFSTEDDLDSTISPFKTSKR